MSAPRLLLLHDQRSLLQVVGRICLRHHASFDLVKSQSDLLEILWRGVDLPDLVVAKDVGPDWFTVAATLIASRALGLQVPFIVVAEPSDAWTNAAVETAGAAVLIDDRSSRWLVPLLVQDWLERAARAGGTTTREKASTSRSNRSQEHRSDAFRAA